MRIEDMANWTEDQLKKEVVRLSEECEKKQHKILDKDDRINGLQTDLDNMYNYCNELKKQVNEKADLPFCDAPTEIAKYERQHQSDCITINQLATALDIVIDRYAALRKIHGLS